jgi:DNA recombination protein RmuC
MEIALIVLAVAVVVAAAILAFALRKPAAPIAIEPPRPDPRIDTLIAEQGKIGGQFSQTLEAQAQLQKALGERIDALNQRLGETLTDSATKTAATISSIGERLTVIDEAQKNISALSGHVVGLQQVLSNKQARGAFGQGRMESIIADAFPAGMYEFQATLSNGSRPDCTIKLPGTKTVIIIDSKFPMECFTALNAAVTDVDRRAAEARVRSDIGKHVKDIASKYLIPGETQTPALMFVPSESIYAELYDGFLDVIQKAQVAQVTIVSPNILNLVVSTIQAMLKDTRMREQANMIQREVGALTKDVRLLGERVEKLQRHFNQADGDIKDILVSASKISSRGEKIGNVELPSPDVAQPRLTSD